MTASPAAVLRAAGFALAHGLGSIGIGGTKCAIFGIDGNDGDVLAIEAGLRDHRASRRSVQRRE